jgi:hypothetical protein
MAIIAHFNLEIKQFNIINIFINANRPLNSVLVAYQLLDGFKQLRICVEVNRALYGLKDSPML